MEFGIVGATGFIGGHVAREALRRGHRVRAYLRDVARRGSLPEDVRLSLVPASSPFQGLDALVIAVGALQGPGMVEAHRDLPARLAAAAREAGIRRVVLVSAVGAAPDAATAFLRSKAEGEAAFERHRQDGWTIVRPSLVYGPGGTSMGFLAMLAALPVRPRVSSGPVRPIAVDDVAKAIVSLLEQAGPLPLRVDLVGPERMTLNDYVDGIGQWLGTPPMLRLRVPPPLMSLGARLGNALGIGLASPDALLMLRAGADGDPAPMQRLTNIAPATLAQGLARHPATSEELLAARLGPWPEILRWTLAILWIGSGLASLLNMEAGFALLASGGVGGRLALVFIVGGAVWDLVLGAATASRRHLPLVLSLQALTMIVYTLIGTVLVPFVWADPLGQLLKNVPILAATLLLAAISRK